MQPSCDATTRHADIRDASAEELNSVRHYDLGIAIDSEALMTPTLQIRANVPCVRNLLW